MGNYLKERKLILFTNRAVRGIKMAVISGLCVVYDINLFIRLQLMIVREAITNVGETVN